MKLVLYRDGIVIDVAENVEGLKIKDNKFSWKDGSFEGLREDVEFIIVPDTVIVKTGDPVNLSERIDPSVFSETDEVKSLESLTDGMREIDDYTLMEVMNAKEKLLSLEERIAALEAKLNGGTA